MSNCTPVVFQQPCGKIPGKYMGLSMFGGKLVSSVYPSWNHSVEYRTVDSVLVSLGAKPENISAIAIDVSPVTNLFIGSIECDTCITFYAKTTTRDSDGFIYLYTGTDTETGEYKSTTWSY